MSLKPKKVSIVFYVSDILRTERFYNETLSLGLDRSLQPEGFGPLLAFEPEPWREHRPACRGPRWGLEWDVPLEPDSSRG